MFKIRGCHSGVCMMRMLLGGSSITNLVVALGFGMFSPDFWADLD